MAMGSGTVPPRSKVGGKEMTAKNGGKTIICSMLIAMAGTLLPPLPAAVQTNGHPQDDLQKQIALLADKLGAPGADGRSDRETAVERLLVMSVAEAHAELHLVLARSEDPDALRMTILRALSQHLLGVEASHFGKADADRRRQIYTGYVGVMSRWWGGSPAPEPKLAALRHAARTALQRIPVRGLEHGTRTLLGSADVENKVAIFTCLADLQHLYLSQLLADHIEDPDENVRVAARAALRRLTFQDEEFVTRAQFATWFEQNVDVRYEDLAESAARAASQRIDDIRSQLDALRIARARDVVRACANASTGVDWATIQKETLVADSLLVRACLQSLREALAEGNPPGGAEPARQAFCRALVERWKLTPPDRFALRADLLEVAAYTARPTETELANEIRGHLLARLKSAHAGEQLASLRGLCRFPSDEARAAVVLHAQAAASQGDAGASRLRAAVVTLSARASGWSAPAPAAADKAPWLALIRSIFEDKRFADLHDMAFELALTEDTERQRVPEIHGLLLDLAQDVRQVPTLRSKCVIQLGNWKYTPGAAAWVAAQHRLVADAETSLRLRAARGLGSLAREDDQRKPKWLEATIDVLRDRLAVEPDKNVLASLVESLIACGSEPQMPARAIAAINAALTTIGKPVPEPHLFRIDPMLGALTAIAGDADAGNGVWLDACEPLLAHGGMRPSLRLLLDEKHSAIGLAKEVVNADAAIAQRARRAMQVLIRTALQRPADQPWRSTPALLAEANEVSTAFGLLDPIDGARLEEPVYRLLRLEVELATGRGLEKVVERATALLVSGQPNPAPGGAASWTPEQKDRVRAIAAEAQLALQKPGLAARLLVDRDSARPMTAGELVLAGKVGKALVATDAATAVALFDRVRRATPVDDPAFRVRLIDWATARVGQDPATQAQVWAEVRPHAALFEAADCPKELKSAFQGLRGER